MFLKKTCSMHAETHGDPREQVKMMWFSRRRPSHCPKSDLGTLPVADSAPVWLFLCLVCVFVAQMLTVPFLADIDKSGKLYLFIFFVLGSLLYHLKSSTPLRLSPVSVVFGVFWLMLVVSASQAFFPEWALLQSAILLVCLVFMLMVSHVAGSASSFKEKLVDMLLVLGVVAALFGLYEFLSFSLLGPSGGMLIPYLLPPNTHWRIGGIYGQPNLFAVLLTVALLAFYYRYLHTLKRESFVLQSWLRFVPVVLIEFVFFLTGSKGGLLSRVLILAFLIWLILRKSYLADSPEGKKEFFRLLFCMGLAFLLSRGVPWLFTDVNLSRGAILLGASSSERYIYWGSSALIFADYPLFGVGLDNWRFFQNAYGPLAHDFLGFVPYEAMISTNWAHNEFLQILAEGGIFPFLILLLLLLVLLFQILKKFFRKNTMQSPVFFYSHLFLLPFIIQSMFSWTFRHPALLILFFLLLGNLLAQYPLYSVRLSRPFRISMAILCVLSLGLTGVLAKQEMDIKGFFTNLQQADSVEETLPEFDDLVNNPYSRHRVLVAALPGYAFQARGAETTALTERILPYAEELAALEGVRWQWYSLALLYLKAGREEDARRATQKSIDLMPSDDRLWAFMHYLNIRKASRETGRPLEDFVPQGAPVTYSPVEIFNERR